MTAAHDAVRKLVKDYNTLLEEACEAALVTGTHGVAEVVQRTEDIFTTGYTIHITELVPWGELYSFPSVEAWERFKARHAENR